MTKKIITYSSAETENVGAELAKTLNSGDFVAMYGDLGVGKTAFIRGIAKQLCPAARVQSPTYTIVNEYRGDVPLFHFDMYRIDSEETLYATGFFDYAERGVIAAEWCENIDGFVPENSVFVTVEKDLSSGDENKRIITIEDKR
ncbi:MAG: tRNA (adenosine(37)-N6)-threonylcarbamoyltransferase complex ATPase subunit type 1 TsaE [Clostridia bacterium]|nr:tRNA (adenosine(37)-N6)-threonylcarbamoyltransferase complex ATPase subunit type 1 TsaE [Clostridia bacterium]MBR7083421.1 tRNA (adenosine(37)-N6)-threonylcarbamoyltransferase complex ATPase subunit type 1 TsaE [Clostridia bacterium]